MRDVAKAVRVGLVFCAPACLAVCLVSQTAVAEVSHPPLRDKYHVTPEERAACSEDAVRLCSSSYPDEDALIVCMKASRAQLSQQCQTAFDVGLKRRHL